MHFDASRTLSAAFVSVIALLASVSVRAAETFNFSDIAGWWSAEPEFAGESSRVLLHFVEDKGKQTMRLSLLGIGGYEVPIGTVKISGDRLDLEPIPFPLRYDAAKGTLSGMLPEAAVPVYRIPVEFRRTEPVAKPAPPSWKFAQPRVKWQLDVKGPVWAGLEYDAQSGRLFVGTDNGTLYAIDTAKGGNGAAAWSFETGQPIKARPTAIGDAVYVASDSGFLYKLDTRSGTERWRAKIDTGSPARIPASEEKSRWDRYGSSVVADGERLYVGSRTYDLIALDAATGKELWKHYYWFSWIESPPVVRDHVVYTGSSDGTGVFAIDAKTGSLRWKASVPGWAWARTAVDDHLVVAGTVGLGAYPGVRSGSLVGIDRRSGTIRWMYVEPPTVEQVEKRVEWGFAAAPVVVDGTAYAADLNGRVYAIESG